MINDLRYAVRGFLRTPTFSVVAIITLALGIGANTAIFSVVNGVLLRPLPYADAAALVQVWTTTTDEPKSSHAAADFLELQRDNRTLTKIAGYREDAFTLALPGQEPNRVSGGLVTVDYFDVMGMPAALGRTFNRAADGASREPLVVLGHSAWQNTFASDPQIVSRRVSINGVPHTVVGVMPASFDYPEEAKAWVLSSQPVPLPPVDVPGDLLESRNVHYFQAVGRLKTGVTREQASADLAAIAADQARRFPESNGGRGAMVEPLHETIVGDVREALVVLLAAVGVVLLIACANVASLLIARASSRQRELAIRAAMGAARGRLVRQLVTESVLLGAAGGIVGVLAGSWAIALLLKVLPDNIPRAAQIGLDARVTAIAMVVSLASALLFGLVPALQASRADGSLVLREAERGSSGRRRARTRAVLVVCEIALTLVLLVSAGLLANSFLRLQKVDPGFKPEQVTLVALPLPLSKYPDGKRQTAFYKRIVESMQQRPEIQSAAILFPSPLEGNNANGTVTIEGQPRTTRGDRPFAAIASVSEDYFRTLGIPIVRGRAFDARDIDPAPAAAIVNATFVRRYLGSTKDPIGTRLRFGDDGEDWFAIVGVAGDSRNVGLNHQPTPLLYLPYHRFPLAFMDIAARSAAGPGAVAAAVRQAVTDADPEMPVDKIAPLSEIIHDSVAEPRFRTLLLGAFALIAVILAAVGVYGLISFSVAQRTREIGIRVALGAQARQVMQPVLREGMTLAGIGVALGLAGAFAATRVLSAFLFGVGTTDPLTFAAVTILLLGVAFLACYIPSRRALRVDPITALRAE